MKNYLKHDPWSIIEEGFHPAYNRISESIFSIGNGRMGQRANFEEGYGGDTLQGSYVAGVYYPDKTRVGWWKIGYPEYFAKVLNAPNWIGIALQVDGEKVDLATATVLDFRRELNMKEGWLGRSCRLRLPSGKELNLETRRFCSIVDQEAGAIRMRIQPLNFEGVLEITPFVDADVMNEDANYGEKFWDEVSRSIEQRQGWVVAETRKTHFHVATGMRFQVLKNGEEVSAPALQEEREKFVGCKLEVPCKDEDEILVYKFGAVVSSLNWEKDLLPDRCRQVLELAALKGFDKMLEEQAEAWQNKWTEADILIEGDVAAQQGIRFNIFQLYQTYTGEDERLNIGPKGFTGEKYGGSTYWDTEAYCLPFYLATAEQKVARNLLVYRYRHLPKAIENARKLGFTDGAALYPMVTMNGEECHNEWEITFEEIHRNGAIAYAIYDYIRYTGDKDYLAECGLEVLIGIARFWAQRVHWSKRRGKYVMHGVTGPNEYENNVNNNWYTNYIAVWCLKYTLHALEWVKNNHPNRYETVLEKAKFYNHSETSKWEHIIANMYLPYDDELRVFVQHDGFLDKELQTVDALPQTVRPLNQNWSWDRILRSCFIKQADVLQGLYFFQDDFTEETIRRNFEFYEPMTVHESSLSPCIHAILAARLGLEEKAYQMYLRTARLDLDDYNNDTEDGCHITSMAGTWMAVVKGFGGMRVKNDLLHLDPFLPKAWKSYAFKIRFRGALLEVRVSPFGTTLVNHSSQPVPVVVYGDVFRLEPKGWVEVSRQQAQA